MGYKIFEKNFPFNSSAIHGAHLRETIDKSGCCGMDELIKLGAFELTGYHRVMLVDTDTLIVQVVDELWEYEEEFLFTFDHPMNAKSAAAPPVQGGFMVLRPSLRRYEDLVLAVRTGDFQPGSGWGGKGVGWCYGGQTIQVRETMLERGCVFRHAS